MNTLTFSAITAFLNCRKYYFNRYIRAIEPADRPDLLRFGSIAHKAIENYYNGMAPERIRHELYDECRTSEWYSQEKRQELYVWAMIIGYMKRYPREEEEWEVVAVEPVFDVAIENPEGKGKSRKFKMSGRVDGLVRSRDTGEYAIMEHKTTSRPLDSFLSRIWTDFQIHLYAHYLGIDRGIKIEKVIYNILFKSQKRRVGLQSKKVDAKIESDGELLERLLEQHLYDGDKLYHREEIIISPGRLKEISEEVWEVKDQILMAQRRNKYYKNPSYCFHWNRPCMYYELCKSGDSPVLIENYFRPRIPHEELTDETPAERTKQTQG